MVSFPKPHEFALFATMVAAPGCDSRPAPLPLSNDPTELVATMNECRDIWVCQLNPCNPEAPENVSTPFELAPAAGQTLPQIGHTANLCAFRAPVVCTLTSDNSTVYAWTDGLRAPYDPHITVDRHDLAPGSNFAHWTANLCPNLSVTLTSMQEKESTPHLPIGL